MKPRHILMIAGLFFSGGLVLFGDKTPHNQVVESISRENPKDLKQGAATVAGNGMSSAENNSANLKADTDHEPTILKLLPRTDVAHGNAAENALFANQNWTPPAPPPPPPAPPPPPTAPAIPFTYAGKRIVDGTWEVFLTRGDNMIYAHSGSTIESVYRIDSIAPPTLTMTYIPLNQKQTISIGDAE